ncbi:MAG: hypothetical protein HND44_00050 [Chloroflexi bacterium]|nr:hypothetical protein [Ardenticatenaceae bacterium]MBL1126898.1 hypothetical protein [Chloroflexota bacterium]NOG32954.1 hypothetical protein [Chloroflexota bacterium]
MKKEVEVMRVLRVPPMGKLVVEFRGNRYENIAQVSEEKVKRFLLTAVGELMAFSGGYQTLVDEGLAPPIITSDSKTQSDESLSEQQARFLASLEASRDALKAEKKRISSLSGISHVSAAPSSALNPVEQIDRILQQYVEADPALSGRSIHLVQHPAGGLQIDVDGKRYQRPSEIDDQRIQILIKKAIKEWEAG